MFSAKNDYDVTELLQEQFTDLDIIRKKPFVFKVDDYLLISSPVMFGEHDKFLKDMANIIQKHYKVFLDIDFLTALNHEDPSAVKKIINQVKIFEANKNFSSFKKDTIKFICRWAFVTTKKKGMVKLKHSTRKTKKALDLMKGDEVVHFLFILFVYNFDIVKKNLWELVQMFQGNIQEPKGKSSQQTQSSKMHKKVIMPEYSDKAYSKETLKIFEEQSTMRS